RSGVDFRRPVPATRYCPPRWGGGPMLLRRAGAPLLALLLLAVLTACSGGGGGGSGTSASDLLTHAKKTLDAASSAHFVLTSDGAPSTGTLLVGGDGDIERPSSFQGTLKVQTAGSTA